MKKIKYQRYGRLTKQHGVAILGTVLVLLIIVSLVGIAASKSTVLETRMVFNMQDKQRSTVAADSAAIMGWNQVKANFDPAVFINNGSDGYYVLTDAYPVADSVKKTSDWNNHETVSGWSWGDNTKSIVMNEPIGGAANPMKLTGKPQFAIGIHKEGFRKGTPNYHCVPISIIGASQGGTDKTRTLVELRAIPKSACFHTKIK